MCWKFLDLNPLSANPTKYLWNWRLKGAEKELKLMMIKRNNFDIFPANIYLFKVNIRNSRKGCEIDLKLTIKTPEQRQ